MTMEMTTGMKTDLTSWIQSGGRNPVSLTYPEMSFYLDEMVLTPFSLWSKIHFMFDTFVWSRAVCGDLEVENTG